MFERQGGGCDALSDADGGPGTSVGIPQEGAARSRLMSPRPHSDAGGAMVAPRLRLEGRTGSTPQRTGPYAGAIAAARAAQESTIVTAIRKQMESLEEKLAGQIVRVQQQGDRLRDAAFSRVDAKMGSMETLQPRFDRKLAELSGNYKGLSDEMQAQIRRIDQMDTRLWEWRHQLEDEVRTKFAEMEQSHQQVASAIRLANATGEDSLKRVNNRVRRLEGLLEERLGHSEEMNHSLVALDARLQEIETARIQDLVVCPFEPMSSSSMALADAVAAGATSHGLSIASMDVKLLEAFQKLEQVTKDSQEVQTRLETQEERLRSLRTLMDSKEEHYRSIKFDRQDWESRSKESQTLALDLDKHRIQHSERLEVFQRRFEHHEKAHEEIGDQIRRLQERTYFNLADTPSVGCEECLGLHTTVTSQLAVASATDASTAFSMQECGARLNATDERLDAVTCALQAMRSDGELAPRVAALVESLKQVAPKVMDQEICMRELHEKVGHLEAKAAMAAEPGKTSDAMSARIGHLEKEVSRLKSEIEGSEVPPSAAGSGGGCGGGGRVGGGTGGIGVIDG
mmetsp:Transcript_133145/g.425769  ORF Transcript_133145/g.425769 Transcript_133145/m.425769 type:complete len:570 (+) Transcript_133145:245-1954(+)